MTYRRTSRDSAAARRRPSPRPSAPRRHVYPAAARGRAATRSIRTDLTGERRRAGVPQRPHRGLPGDREPPRRLGRDRRRRSDAHRDRPRRRRSSETLPLPGDGFVSNLQSADRGELIGYTFSDADLGAAGGTRERAVHRIAEGDAKPTRAAPRSRSTGADPRVAEWRFVPDTDSILLLSFDGSLLLTGRDGRGRDRARHGDHDRRHRPRLVGGHRGAVRRDAA